MEIKRVDQITYFSNTTSIQSKNSAFKPVQPKGSLDSYLNIKKYQPFKLSGSMKTDEMMINQFSNVLIASGLYSNCTNSNESTEESKSSCNQASELLNKETYLSQEILCDKLSKLGNDYSDESDIVKLGQNCYEFNKILGNKDNHSQECVHSQFNGGEPSIRNCANSSELSTITEKTGESSTVDVKHNNCGIYSPEERLKRIQKYKDKIEKWKRGENSNKDRYIKRRIH